MAEHSRLRALLGSPYRVGLGGEGVLRTEGRDMDALEMLASACGAGSGTTTPPQRMQGANGTRAASGDSTLNGKMRRSRRASPHSGTEQVQQQTLPGRSPGWGVITSGSGRSMTCGIAMISGTWKDAMVPSVPSTRPGRMGPSGASA
jgi:hypothetical protein